MAGEPSQPTLSTNKAVFVDGAVKISSLSTKQASFVDGEAFWSGLSTKMPLFVDADAYGSPRCGKNRPQSAFCAATRRGFWRLWLFWSPRCTQKQPQNAFRAATRKNILSPIKHFGDQRPLQEIILLQDVRVDRTDGGRGPYRDPTKGKTRTRRSSVCLCGGRTTNNDHRNLLL